MPAQAVPQAEKQIILRPTGFTTVEPTRFNETELLHLAAHVRGKEFDRNLLERALKEKYNYVLFPQLAHKEDRDCGTPLLQMVHAARLTKGATERIQADLDRLLDIDPGYTVQTYNTANFTFRYTTDAGTDQVLDPTLDTAVNVTLYNQPTIIGATVAGNGVPNYVERLGVIMEYALACFINPPYNFQNPAAGGRIPVTIEDTSPYLGWASPAGSISISRNLSDFYLNDTPIHELFHLVQFLYIITGSDYEWYEGTARLIPNTVNDLVNRWISSAYTNYAANPNQSLTTLGYDAAAFWEYILEQNTYQSSPADEPYVGIDALRSCWQRGQINGTLGMTTLIQAVEELPYYGQFKDFGYSWPSGTELCSNEVHFGNWLVANYTKDLANPGSDARFDYIEDEEAPTMPSVAKTSLTLAVGSPVNLAGQSVNTYAARYYDIAIGAGVSTIRVNFTAAAGFTDSLLQLVLIDSGNNLVDIIRTKSSTYERIIGNGAGTLNRIVAIVAGLSTGGTFSLQVQSVAAAPDIMITRWNSDAAREYERDPRGWCWNWDSPDIWVDTNDDGVQDYPAFGQANHLYIKVRNKGTADATGVTATFYYQDAGTILADTQWQPVLDKDPADPTATPQTLTFNVPAGSDYTGFVNWYMPVSWTSNHFCVKVQLTYAADGSPDNNMAMNNFNVIHLLHAELNFHVMVRNPFEFRTAVRLVPNLGGIHPKFLGTRGKQSATMYLEPREAKPIRLSLNVPALVKEMVADPVRVFSADAAAALKGRKFVDESEALRYLDGRTISFTQLVGERAVGGVSFKLVAETPAVGPASLNVSGRLARVEDRNQAEQRLEETDEARYIVTVRNPSGKLVRDVVVRLKAITPKPAGVYLFPDEIRVGDVGAEEKSADFTIITKRAESDSVRVQIDVEHSWTEEQREVLLTKTAVIPIEGD